MDIVESFDVRLKRRRAILADVFIGCVIDSVGIDQHTELMNIQRIVGSARKTVAYLDTCVHPVNQHDEFHILFKRVEPMVVEAVERFTATGVAYMSHNVPALMVIAHYEVDKTDDDYQQMVAKSGRQVAFQEQMKRLDDQLREQALKRLMSLSQRVGN